MGIHLLLILSSLLAVLVLEQVRGTTIPYLETIVEGIASFLIALTLCTLIWRV